MIAASIGEAVACLVRVPTEVVKQNMQAQQQSNITATNNNNSSNNKTKQSLIHTICTIIVEDRGQSFIGRGLYRGYGITLVREIPFALIQFPLYEYFKENLAQIQQVSLISPFQAAFCGSVSGRIAAAFTTPLDVLKTRLMLGKDIHGIPYTGAMNVAQRILREERSKVFWSVLNHESYGLAWEVLFSSMNVPAITFANYINGSRVSIIKYNFYYMNNR
jgi:solute carrier family 25 S-adenosylmethionine transporter 26